MTANNVCVDTFFLTVVGSDEIFSLNEERKEKNESKYNSNSLQPSRHGVHCLRMAVSLTMRKRVTHLLISNDRSARRSAFLLRSDFSALELTRSAGDFLILDIDKEEKRLETLMCTDNHSDSERSDYHSSNPYAARSRLFILFVSSIDR